MRGLLPKQTTRTVRLHLDSGAVLEGLLVAVGHDSYVLRSGSVVNGNAGKQPFEGDAFVPKGRVLVVEVSP